ncbi:MAG TPA: dihydroorotase [Bacteroidia bacterium]|nr:dihydroorotase [Bacteroidia bacterium]
MSKKYLIKNIFVASDDYYDYYDVLIEPPYISKIEKCIDSLPENVIEINGENKILIPGMIDDQVHFREPGLTHKGEIYTESKAAVAGGITSYMEMPNTKPPAVSLEELEKKYSIAQNKSLANYSFYIGATNDNLDELLKTDYSKVCGIKIFLGSSTGNLLVDNTKAIEQIFSQTNALIATHCEDDNIIKKNLDRITDEYGFDLPTYYHAIIRNDEACYASSKFAVETAKKYNTRLHILHISTAKELSLFRNDLPLSQKRITAEACIHHLWFTDEDYEKLGNKIKWNPAIKTQYDRDSLIDAVNTDLIDIIATDHAPHTIEEKNKPLLEAPSGGPLVQHALLALFDLYHQKKFTLETIVRKTSHNVADMFQIKNRGYIKEGYFADVVMIDLNKPTTVTKDNIFYKCGWSPFEGHTFSSSIEKTFVNGYLVYDNGTFDESQKGMRLEFDRK